MAKQRVLFIGTHNCARSQMAEALLRTWAGDQFEVHSAGTAATVLQPLTIKAMAEVDIDISGQKSKTLGPFLSEEWDWVITVCDRARALCPVFPGAESAIHWGIVEDPAEATGTEAERFEAFRRARNDIGQRLRTFILAAERTTPAERAVMGGHLAG